ncbi:hypothetical protein [Salinigranum rubrum]|nr:hypothetical protein [Salinigranum rubrum]
MSSNGFAVPEGENKDLVFDFIRYFMTSDAFITYLHAVPFHFCPTNRDVLKTDEYEDNEIVSQHLDFRDMIYEEHSNFRTVPQYQNPPFVGWYEILATKQVASKAISNSIEGRRTPQQAVNTAIDELNGMIGEYRNS